jgi:hypothetical protein
MRNLCSSGIPRALWTSSTVWSNSRQLPGASPPWSVWPERSTVHPGRQNENDIQRVGPESIADECDTGDDGALDSLQPAIRLNWLAANRPARIGEILFTGVSYQPRSRQHAVENRLRVAGTYSPRNDGLLLITDQLIPGGTLLGYANADHWSVALSLENKNFLISETIRAPQPFPRRVLLHALLLYVAEALESNQE